MELSSFCQWRNMNIDSDLPWPRHVIQMKTDLKSILSDAVKMHALIDIAVKHVSSSKQKNL